MDWIKNKLWNISKFNACIPLQLKRSNLIDNGKAYLEEVDPLFKKHWKVSQNNPPKIRVL